MNALQEAAEKVVGNMGDDSLKFNPAFLLLIVDLMGTLVPMMQEWCKKTPEDVVKLAGEPSWMERRVLKRKIVEVMGRRAYRAHGREVSDAVCKTGKEMSVDDIRRLYEEV